MTTYTKIIRGNTGPLWRVGVPSRDSDGNKTGEMENLSTDYVCTIACVDGSIERPVTALNSDDTRFMAQLTPDETKDIPKGKSVVAIQIRNPNTTPEFVIEYHIDVDMKDEYIVNSS